MPEVPESVLAGMLRALQSDQDAPRKRATIQAFHLALASLALPGLPLGLAYTLTHPAPFSPAGCWGLMVVAGVLGLLALWLSARAGRDPRLKPAEARLVAALQLASAPGICLLLGCAAFHQPVLWLALWGLGLVFYVVARQRL